MKRYLKALGWVNYRNRTDWQEIKIDIAVIVTVVILFSFLIDSYS